MTDNRDIQVKSLGVAFQEKEGEFWALKDVSFEIHPQEFVCVLGPSGSGKTTLLRSIAGLQPVTEGTIHFPGSRQPLHIGLMFQQPNLMPWRTTIQNIALPLELEGKPPDMAIAEAQNGSISLDCADLKKFPRDLPAAWHSAWRWLGRSFRSRNCCYWMNLLAHWMR